MLPISSCLTLSGSSKVRLVNWDCSNRIFLRTISWIHSSGISSSRSVSARSFTLRPLKKKVGERCSIVMWAQSGAIAGISVAAVAPEPITSTRLPA